MAIHALLRKWGAEPLLSQEKRNPEPQQVGRKGSLVVPALPPFGRTLCGLPVGHPQGHLKIAGIKNTKDLILYNSTYMKYPE